MIITKITRINENNGVYKSKPKAIAFSAKKDMFIKESRSWLNKYINSSRRNRPKFLNRIEKEYYEYILKNKINFINMKNFENISSTRQNETINFVFSQIQLFEDYERNKFERQNEHQDNSWIDAIKDFFKGLSDSEAGNTGAIQFIEENINNFKSFISEVYEIQNKSFIEDTIKTSKPHKAQGVATSYGKKYSELQAKLREYNRQLGLLPEGAEKKGLLTKKMEVVSEITDLEQRAITENFSLLEKKDLSNATEDERWNYFHDYAFRLMIHNEASTFDGIDMFEKYGMRKLLNTKRYVFKSTLEQFMASLPKEPSDTLTSRLIDVIDKFITSDKPSIGYEIDGVRDLIFFGEHQISEDTLLKAFKLLKKMEFWTTNDKNILIKFKIHFSDFRFKDSPRLGEIIDSLKEMQNLFVKNGKSLYKVF